MILLLTQNCRVIMVVDHLGEPLAGLPSPPQPCPAAWPPAFSSSPLLFPVFWLASWPASAPSLTGAPACPHSLHCLPLCWQSPHSGCLLPAGSHALPDTKVTCVIQGARRELQCVAVGDSHMSATNTDMCHRHRHMPQMLPDQQHKHGVAVTKSAHVFAMRLDP